MRYFRIALLFTILYFLVSSSFLYADELSELKAQMKALQKQMELMQKKIERLEVKEKEKVKSVAKTETVSEVVEQKFCALEEEITSIQQQHKSLFTTLEEKVDFNLYVTLEFEDFKNTASLFDAHNVELLAAVHLANRLKAFTEIEYERTATTDAGSRQGEIEVEQGWLEYAISDYFKPRFGVLLVPFGKFNLEHFDPFRDLTDRPVAMRRVVPATWAEAGAGFTGTAFLGEKLGGWLEEFSLDYQLFLVNGLTNAITDTGSRSARGAFGSDNNNNKAVVGRLGIFPFSGVEIGLSGYSGKYDTDGHEIKGFDVDWDFNKGPFELIGEWAFFDLEEGGLQTDGATVVPQSLRGGYVQANYHFWFDFLNNTFLGKHFEDPTFTAALRYGQARIDDDSDANTGINKEERWTMGLNYRPTPTFVFKLEYQFNQSENESLERGDNNGFIASVSAAF
jgi:hypothetical protein